MLLIFSGFSKISIWVVSSISLTTKEENVSDNFFIWDFLTKLELGLIIKEGVSILGVKLTPDVTTYETVTGMVKNAEVYAFAEMIISFFFGAALAKPR